MRKIFLTNPASEFDLSPEEYLELPKPIYGLFYSVEERNRTLHDRVQIDFKINLTLIDISLYWQFEDEQLLGINASSIDDLLRAGADGWQTHSDATLERSETTRNQQAPFTSAGMHITES